MPFQTHSRGFWSQLISHKTAVDLGARSLASCIAPIYRASCKGEANKQTKRLSSRNVSKQWLLSPKTLHLAVPKSASPAQWEGLSPLGGPLQASGHSVVIKMEPIHGPTAVALSWVQVLSVYLRQALTTVYLYLWFFSFLKSLPRGNQSQGSSASSVRGATHPTFSLLQAMDALMMVSDSGVTLPDSCAHRT